MLHFWISLLLGVFCRFCDGQSPSVCSNPPGVSNGRVREVGPYYENTCVTYDCNMEYEGGGTTCCDNTSGIMTWDPDPDNFVCTYAKNDQFFSSYGSALPEWLEVLLGVVLGLLLLVLIAVLIAALWHLCCSRYYCNCCGGGSDPDSAVLSTQTEAVYYTDNTGKTRELFPSSDLRLVGTENHIGVQVGTRHGFEGNHYTGGLIRAFETYDENNGGGGGTSQPDPYMPVYKSQQGRNPRPQQPVWMPHAKT